VNAAPESRPPLQGPCPNCGDPRPGNYCPNCGQRRIERRVTLRRMLGEALEDQFSVNSALPRTLKYLLLHPGFLSREYVAARIQRYIPPFRLYLVSSLLFFLTLSFATTMNEDSFINIRADGAEAGDTTAAATESLGADSVGAGDGVAGSGPNIATTAAVDSALAPLDSAAIAAAERAQADSLADTFLEKITFRSRSAVLDTAVNRKLREFRRMEARQVLRLVFAETVRRTPTALFLLLPVFALLLKLLYIRRRRYYVEHFVFGLHTHAFTFILLTAALLLPGWIDALLMAWTVVYFYLAMKRFYGQGWFKTLVKYVTLTFTYTIVFSVAMVLTLLAAVLLA
jgi:hypothetical protein